MEKDVGTEGCTNMEEKIVRIVNAMAEFLSIEQLKKLQEVIVQELSENEPQRENISNDEYITRFLNAKQMEGCSDRTIQYYRVTVEHFLKDISNPVRKISTEQIRDYLVRYQKINNCSKVTVDNIRRKDNQIRSVSHYRSENLLYVFQPEVQNEDKNTPMDTTKQGSSRTQIQTAA